MEVKMRFRTDGWNWAEMKRVGTGVSDLELKEFGWDADAYNNTPPAEAGDVWRIHWHKEGGEGPIAGYAIACIKCDQVHSWTTANNCEPKIEHKFKDVNGNEQTYTTCTHSGVGSCWVWTGSAEDNMLTASPSLLSNECGFHGHLQNGILHD